MTTVRCQHSGIEFEAKTSRTKQHPLVAELKETANRRGNYREVCTAMGAVRLAGGYASVDEFIERVNAYINEQRQAEAKRVKMFAEAEAKRKAEALAEDEKLKAHGYVLREVVESINDDGQGEYDLVTRKYLFSPDGRKVSRQQALNEIERGTETVLGEIAQKEAAQREQRQAAAKEQATKTAAKTADLSKLDDEATRIKATCQEIDRPADVEWVTHVATPSHDGNSYRAHDFIKKSVSAPALYWICTGTGYDDDGYSVYYTEAQQPALSVEAPDDSSDPDDDIF